MRAARYESYAGTNNNMIMHGGGWRNLSTASNRET